MKEMLSIKLNISIKTVKFFNIGKQQKENILLPSFEL